MAMIADMLEGSWTHATIATNGINLHYVEQGHGPLLLLLHGFPEFWYSWRHQIPEFARDYRVVALDLRGYNESDKPEGVEAYRIPELLADIAGVIEGLGYDRCTLVGHDWGGGLAWQFAYAYPERVEKLAVMNCPHPAKFAAGLRTPEQLLRSWYVFAFQVPVLPELLFQFNDYAAIANAFIEEAIDKSAFSSADLDAFKDAAAKRGALTAMVNYYRAALTEITTDKHWDILRIPTLLIWAEGDRFLGKSLAEGTEAYVQNLMVKYIPNCSHWVQQEQPQRVNQYLREFLDIEDAIIESPVRVSEPSPEF